METLMKKKTVLDAKLADPALYAGPPAAVSVLQRDAAEIGRELATAEAEWLAANELIEQEIAAE